MSQGRKSELIVAMCMMALSLFLFICAVRIPEPKQLISGTRIVPVAATSLMLAFALIRGISLLRGMGEETRRVAASDYRKWTLVIVALIAYAGVLETVGFLIATILLLIVLLPLFGIAKLSTNIVAAVSIAGGIWLLFVKVFGSYLPSGTIL